MFVTKFDEATSVKLGEAKIKGPLSPRDLEKFFQAVKGDVFNNIEFRDALTDMVFDRLGAMNLDMDEDALNDYMNDVNMFFSDTIEEGIYDVKIKKIPKYIADYK